MVINPQVTVSPTCYSRDLGSRSGVDASGESRRHTVVIDSDRASLAASPDQAHLRLSLVELARKLAVEPYYATPLSTALTDSLFPAIIDGICFRNDRRTNWEFESRLSRAFEDTPLEDGISHPAESIIDEALQLIDAQRALDWLEALSSDTKRPELSASVLRCLGRRRPGTPSWRAGSVQTVLSANDLEMRDAAVQAAESWGGPEMRDALRKHDETIPWLRAYVEDVVADLEA